MGRDEARGRAILIAGPTASGKSALALGLAQKLGGTLVNADSMQVYADLRVLSSRPTDAELNAVPHRLFGHVDGAESYSVARWLTEARDVLQSIRLEGRVPILVGGTGLYIKALTQGLSAIPPVPDAIRAKVRGEADGVPPETLHARLAAVDPRSASRLRPTDPQRIVRALEVFEATGRSLAGFQGEREAPILAATDYLGFFATIERAALNARIDRRFDGMVEEGALDEVAALLRRRLDPALPVMRALGVPQLASALEGSSSLADAVTAAKHQTRLYAKRQVTFGRHQLGALAPVEPSSAAATIEAAWRSSR